jgi:hypothetical protein
MPVAWSYERVAPASAAPSPAAASVGRGSSPITETGQWPVRRVIAQEDVGFESGNRLGS